MAEADVFTLAGGTVLAGIDLQPMPDAAIVVSNGRIEAIGSTADGGGDAIDVSGWTLMPGFIDCHVHIGFYEPAEVLFGGVTVVRDLGWPPDEIFPLADRSEYSDFDGPLVLAVGPMITVDGGYPTRAAWAPSGAGMAVTEVDARDAVSQVASRGACAIKIALNPPVGPVLDDRTLSTVVDAAHAAGLEVTAHIHGLEQLLRAIDAGVDELAHVLMGEERIDQGTTKKMVDAGMTLVPTLSIFSGEALETAIANVASFHSAGGRIVYGTDLGNEGPRPGIDASEVIGMAHAGMSGAQIIAAATTSAAAHLRLSNKGVLAEGYDADIVGVRGDPLSDPTALGNVGFVMREGRVVRGP